MPALPVIEQPSELENAGPKASAIQRPTKARLEDNPVKGAPPMYNCSIHPWAYCPELLFLCAIGSAVLFFRPSWHFAGEIGGRITRCQRLY